MTSSELPVDIHNTNKAILESVTNVIGSTPTPTPINPLLSRPKLKTKKSHKKKPPAAPKEALVATVNDVKSTELKAIGSLEGEEGIPEGEEGNVLDLADSLLDQLDAQRAEEKQQQVDELAKKELEKKNHSLNAERLENLGGTRASRESISSVTSGRSAREMLHNFKEDMKEMLKINGSGGTSSSTGNGKRNLLRQQARKLRKLTEIDDLKLKAQAEVEAENDNSVGEERKAIDDGCIKLGVVVKEIEPDGHCLFGAIADQVNYHNLSTTAEKETYITIRQHAGAYMRANPDEFLPFLESEETDGLMTSENFERYCNMVSDTAEWGGQHEIMALAKAFNSPIHVLQAGTDLVKVGEEITSGRGPMLISYHRKMYGLGEHYNSLRPASSMHPSEILSSETTTPDIA